ncbi:MAG: peptide deformylase, partial [Erysipelotrichaceae bacterium]
MHINNKTIIKDDNPILRNKSKKVDLPLDKKDKTVLLNMLQYVRDSHDPDLCEKYDLRAAVGIAAIQLGIEKQMLAVCIETEENTTEYALVNAKIVSYSLQDAYLANGEGCLSAAVEHEG